MLVRTYLKKGPAFQTSQNRSLWSTEVARAARCQTSFEVAPPRPESITEMWLVGGLAALNIGLA